MHVSILERASSVNIDQRRIPTNAFVKDSGFIQIDSLVNYDVRNIKSISIEFDLPTAVYGLQAELGIIVINRKNIISDGGSKAMRRKIRREKYKRSQPRIL